MTRTIYAGRERLIGARGVGHVPWHGRTYRLAGPLVEVWDRRRLAWLPSIRLTTQRAERTGRMNRVHCWLFGHDWLRASAPGHVRLRCASVRPRDTRPARPGGPRRAARRHPPGKKAKTPRATVVRP